MCAEIVAPKTDPTQNSSGHETRGGSDGDGLGPEIGDSHTETENLPVEEPDASTGGTDAVHGTRGGPCSGELEDDGERAYKSDVKGVVTGCQEIGHHLTAEAEDGQV